MKETEKNRVALYLYFYYQEDTAVGLTHADVAGHPGLPAACHVLIDPIRMQLAAMSQFVGTSAPETRTPSGQPTKSALCVTA